MIHMIMIKYLIQQSVKHGGTLSER